MYCLIAILTSTIRESFPTRVKTIFQNKSGQVALDQLRAVDRTRIVKKLVGLDEKTSKKVLNTLSIMFKP